MKRDKRKIELVVLSDIHLGTYGCHAMELLNYLKSIKPKTLILNGDIIDVWQFKKRYWPKAHMKVVKEIIHLSTKGTKVYYITGNHDETFRRFADTSIGNISIVNNLEVNLDGKKAWLFHGDVFDVIMQHSKWLAKLGAIGYDALILLNIIINKISTLLGRNKISLSGKVKDNVKSAVKYINNFEECAAKLAIQKGFDYIICGHIHRPENRIITDNKKTINYLNSGDWVENLTALEYNSKEWRIFQYRIDQQPDSSQSNIENDANKLLDLNNKEIFNMMLEEFKN